MSEEAVSEPPNTITSGFFIFKEILLRISVAKFVIIGLCFFLCIIGPNPCNPPRRICSELYS